MSIFFSITEDYQEPQSEAHVGRTGQTPRRRSTLLSILTASLAWKRRPAHELLKLIFPVCMRAISPSHA
jgi:hypothetical protein